MHWVLLAAGDGIAGVTLLGASAEMCGPALIHSLAGETGHKLVVQPPERRLTDPATDMPYCDRYDVA